MASTPRSTAAGFYGKIAGTDVTSDFLPLICLPDADHRHFRRRRRRRRSDPRAHEADPARQLAVIEGDSYHVAATHAEECARKTIEFIERTAVKA